MTGWDEVAEISCPVTSQWENKLSQNSILNLPSTHFDDNSINNAVQCCAVLCTVIFNIIVFVSITGNKQWRMRPEKRNISGHVLKMRLGGPADT